MIIALSLLAAQTIAKSAIAASSNLHLQNWIDQLADINGSTCDAAENNLISAGKPAVALLHIAATDPRIAVQIRARRALRKIQMFLLPGVSDESLAAAQQYLGAPDADHRKPYLNKLFAVQPPPNAVLTRLIPLEPDEDLQRQILYQLGLGYRDAVPRLLVDDDDPQALVMLLNASAEMWGRGEAADDAVALLFTGQIDQQIALCTAEQTNGDTDAKEHAATQLCYLYRVTGKSELALKYARLSRDPAFIFLVLQDQGDWSTAAKEPDDRWRDPMIAGAYHAAFQRLSGHPQAGIDIMSAVAGEAPNDIDRSFTPSRFFLLNDLPERGMQLLTEQHPAVVFQMRVQRGEIRQAIDIAEKYQGNPHDGTELASRYQLLRQSLGELPQPATMPSQDPENVPPDPAEKIWQEAVQNLIEKKYQAAADGFAKAWASDHTHFDRLYLQGYALQQLGQTDRGKAMMQLAQMLPLGDPLQRWRLAANLDAAGLPDDAEQQRNVALRTGGDFDELGFSEIYNTQSEIAFDHKQWRRAADALDRLCLINLSPALEWHDPVRLLTVPALAHLAKAHEARDRHDLETTMMELQQYQQYLPMSSEMVLDIVPALDAAGEHTKADKLFDDVYKKLNAICRDYPESVNYLNELAWMCACSNRQLEEALRAAQSAIILEPQDWRLMDTLAEVRFRRGDRTGAVEMEKHAKSITSDEYIARQLKRFESERIPSTTQPVAAPE